MKKVSIVSVESDFGAGIKGAKLGPQALLKTLNPQVIEGISQKVIDTRDLQEDTETPYALHISSILEVQKRAVSSIENLFKEQQIPFVISGDHSNGLAAISAYKNQFPNNRLGVIWIDAHADMHTPFTSHSGNMHGMPLAAALNISQGENPRNKPERSTIQNRTELCKIGSNHISPKLLPEDLVLIDLRDTEQEEIDLLERLNVKYFRPEQRHENGIQDIISQTLSHLSHCDHLLVSFDVDSMDPSISSGTGTPVHDGLSMEDSITLLTQFLSEPKLIAFEVTEINPLLDRHQPMEKAAAKVLEAAFAQSGFLDRQ